MNCPGIARVFYFIEVVVLKAFLAAKVAHKVLQDQNARSIIYGVVIFIIVIIVSYFAMIAILIGSVTSMFNVSTGFKSGTASNIARSEIPAELMPIFVSAQEKYGVSWAVLAAICKIETEFGDNVAVSSAGAIGFMQFMPGTWEAYKVDGNGDGIYDPYNPWDAIFTAANYLKASGFDQDPSRAIFQYNRSDWYVNKVMELSMVYSGQMMPTGNGLWPVPGYLEINSPFGYRNHPIRGTISFHEGIDIPAPTGTPVVAAMGGRVARAQGMGGYGLTVEIEHGGSMTLYAHLSGFAVRRGDIVEAGQVIGYVGSTGNSTGPHLHFGVYVNGNPCDPQEWLQIITDNY